VRTWKKQQAKACWKCCKTTKNTQKFLLRNKINFTHKNQQINEVFFSLLQNRKCPKEKGKWQKIEQKILEAYVG